ncbi:hypothetical protein GDO86_010773 [Hymenochirus boettgeri]|uniref:Uncharacterized protein n=1 Tax=Hymenochirus boettgeri TaxID=247094 RepID=A0A8T2JEI4_9PIPI|nr:hypothetical protein GDO86_010773 [Hymenochirus boettgeri]
MDKTSHYFQSSKRYFFYIYIFFFFEPPAPPKKIRSGAFHLNLYKPIPLAFIQFQNNLKCYKQPAHETLFYRTDLLCDI